jgi:hypothetical protein
LDVLWAVRKWWRTWARIACILALWVGVVRGEEIPDSPGATTAADSASIAVSRETSAAATDTVTPHKPHAFWDRKNLYLFSGIAAMRTLDYTSTRNMQRRGREEILLPDDVVNSRPGFVALEVSGAATSIGISYILHATRHHKLERWLSIGHIGVTGFGAARNYALVSKHPAP